MEWELMEMSGLLSLWICKQGPEQHWDNLCGISRLQSNISHSRKSFDMV